MDTRAILTISRLLNQYQDVRNLIFTKCPSLRLFLAIRFLNATDKIQMNNYHHRHCGRSCTLASCFSSTILKCLNPTHTGWCGAGGGGGRVNLHSVTVTPFSLKLDGSDFLQNYSGVRSIFWSKKIKMKSTMTLLWRHLFSDEYQ